VRPGDPVPYPEGYRHWTHVKSMVIEEGHPLFASFGGIHHIYVNPSALAGLKSGTYVDGAVFAFDLLEAKKEGGAEVEGARKVLGVMHKDATAFASTGGWGFAGFGGNTRDNVVKDPVGGCFNCHAAQKDKGYVFTQWRD
jgi:hypothetical protein